MKRLAFVLAIMLVVALIWRSCAGNADDSRGQTEPTQAAWRDAPQPAGTVQASRAPGAAPELQDRQSMAVLNDGPRAPGETDRQYRDRMEVVAGLEAFRQRSGIGEERYRGILMAIYDHQYNWARFRESHPYGDGTPTEDREAMVRDLTWTLQQRITGPMTIEERMIWFEACPRCFVQLTFGPPVVSIDEPSPRPEGER